MGRNDIAWHDGYSRRDERKGCKSMRRFSFPGLALVMVIAGLLVANVVVLRNISSEGDGPRPSGEARSEQRPDPSGGGSGDRRGRGRDRGSAKGGREPAVMAAGSEAEVGQPASASLATGRRPFVQDRLVLRFRAGTPEAERRRVRAEAGVKLVRRLPQLGAEVVALPARADVRAAREALSRRPEISYSEPDYIYEMSPSVPNDPSFSQLWGLHNPGDTDVDAPEAWDVTRGSRAVSVGVVDTGIDYGHPDLQANAWVNPGESGGGRESNGRDDDGNGYVDDFRGWDWIGSDNNPRDENGHGTHVAGTVGASGNNGTGVTGVNWSVSLVPLRVLDAQGAGTSSGIASAFSYAGRKGIDVVNASLGGPSFSQVLLDTIDRYPDTLFVVAAGNDGSNNDQVATYPCNYGPANLICVAAVTKADGLASFSNYGATKVDLAAPGSSILSTLPGGQYGIYSGTSMATPHVAGAAALLKAAVPSLEVDQLRSALLTGAVPMGALQGKTVTGGRLNVLGSLQKVLALVPAPAPTPSPAPSPSLSLSPSPAPAASPTASPSPSPVGSVTPPPTPSPSPSPASASPNPSPLPSPSPDLGAGVASRSISLRLRYHLVAAGRVASASATCSSGVRVAIRRYGVWVTSVRTGTDGRFRIRLKDRTGRYAAAVRLTDSCAAAAASARHAHAVTASATADEVSSAASCGLPAPAEKRLARLANGARGREGLAPLRLDRELSLVARMHSREMMRSGFLTPSTPEALGARVNGWSLLGENVAVGTGAVPLHQIFMSSSPHSRNILSSEYTSVGVGTARSRGRLWVTTVFQAGADPGTSLQMPGC